jgi:AraC-like DNA-binding protein
MAIKILIGPNERRLWDKLDAIQEIDPAAGGGINDVVFGRRRVGRADALGAMFRSGYEEIHQIEPGFCAHVTDAYIDEDWRLTVTSREASVRLRIAFAGEAAYFARQNQLVDAGSLCSFMIRPAGDALTAKFRGGTRHRYCSVNLTQEYLLHTLGLSAEEMPPMLPLHWERHEMVMGHFAASKAALALARRFFGIKSSGTWRDLEVRAIAIELLRVLFEDWRDAQPRVTTSMRFTRPEQEKLQRVRELIESDPAASLTIPALCARFAMNRNKLHYGFKRMFGVSVHHFQTELRMQTAMKLLSTTQLPIGEIAERTGFSEPTNFTAAFKAYFAVSPRHVRSERDTGSPVQLA